MNYRELEEHCMSLPGVSMHTPWGDSRVFKVGGKMFAMITMDGKRPTGVWFKAGEASARILISIKGIEPCPYLARAHWVACDTIHVLKAKEMREYIVRAHRLVAEGLSRKRRAELGISQPEEMR